ncbi:MAG: FG-GAP repeat protein [Deltaproteobacteria bacterium]|nr:FG-GAP repeat protein [Deltaproteobacteria bacterium]MBW1847649.1 FG-GAP repeat protein [Deltaproteobacteria bacterium]
MSRANVVVGVIQPQPTVGFTATPEIIILGESTTLSWNSTHAETAMIDNGIGPVSVSGSEIVSPTVDTIYTLFVNGPGGASATSVEVIVIDPSVPPSINFYVDPTVIFVGESTTLTWSSRGADTATIDNGIGAIQVNGSTSVSPMETTTYEITVNGAGGQNTAYATGLVLHPLDYVKIASSKITLDESLKSVPISGDYAIVGAPSHYVDPEGGLGGLATGAAVIYQRYGSGWVHRQTITADDGYQGDNFGMSVFIDGDYVVVGAPGHYGGCAYIFKRESEGSHWIQKATLTDSDWEWGHQDYFGHSVSISGDTVIVGAYGKDGYYSSQQPDRGAAYIFQFYYYNDLLICMQQ